MNERPSTIAASADAIPIFRGLAGVFVDYTTICEIDDENNKLRYRGYDLGELVGNVAFEDVVHLLLHGELPTETQRRQLAMEMDQNRYLSNGVSQIIDLLPKHASPMAVLRTSISAIGCYYSGTATPAEVRNAAVRLVAQLPLAIGRFRARTHQEASPEIEVGAPHAATVLSQFTGVEVGKLDAADISVVDKLLTIHVEHELNASCFAARVAASTLTDLAAAVTAAVSTLAGSLHGGANERVLRTAQKIGAPEAVDDFVRDAFANKRKIHGFGQRGCKAEDPRAILLRGIAEELSVRKGGSDILPILLAMNKSVQKHRELWPNVDFYSAAVLHDLGIDTELFTPMFACSRVVGWSAHVAEQIDDNRLIRPKAKYVGPQYRHLD